MTKIIRTPNAANGGITAAEKSRMDEHSALWIKRAFRTETTDPAKIGPAIEGIYTAAGLKKPRVVIVPSPLVMAFAYGASAAIWYNRDATYIATRNATDDATDDAAQACFDLAGDFGLACARKWRGCYQGGNMWPGYDCYLTAARDILGLNLPEHVAYAHWEQAAIHGGFRVMHPEFCMVSDFPEFIRVDDQNRPHCADGPSHRWRDGWALYHWHGVAIPAEWLNGSLDAKTAVTWENVEQRRAAIEILGWQNVLSDLDAKSLGGNPDAKIGELIEVQLPFEDEDGNATTRALFLKAQCGTGRTIFEAVDPDEIDLDPRFDPAWCAQAWRDG